MRATFRHLFMLAAAIVGAGLLASAAQAGVESDMEIGVDRMYGDYNQYPLPSADPGECKAACLRDGQCAAWTFVQPGRQAQTAMCYLKNTIPQAAASNCCISGLNPNFRAATLQTPAPQQPQQPQSEQPQQRGQITWNANATELRGAYGDRFTYFCPPRGGTMGNLWGGNPLYTDDSSICRAGMHAGAIGAGGGQVIIEMRAGDGGYTGSTSNGETSANFGGWYGSYVVVR